MSDAASATPSRPGFPFRWLELGAGRLALTHRPRRRWIPHLRRAGCDRVVTVLSQQEGAEEIGAAVRDAGIAWTWIPVASGRPPQGRQIAELLTRVRELSRDIDAGESLLLHCSAGMHRTGMIAYALLRLRGQDRDAALEAISRIRPQTAAGLRPEHLEWVDASGAEPD